MLDYTPLAMNSSPEHHEAQAMDISHYVTDLGLQGVLEDAP